MPPREATSLAQSVARAVLAFTIAVAAGATSNSIPVMLGAFGISMLVLNLGGFTLRWLASSKWGEKPVILAIAMASSVTTAAMAVAAFGVLLAGHLSLNLVLGDLGMKPLDAQIGVIPFIGIIAYCFISTLDGIPGIRKHPMRSLTRGVAAAAMAAVILYMGHAVMHVTGIVRG